MWAIWNQRNTVVYRNCQPNPVTVIEQAKHMYSYIMLYSKYINMYFLSFHAGTNHYNCRKENFTSYWTPLPFNSLKWNTYASRIECMKTTTFNYMCRDNKGIILHSTENLISDTSVLIAEAIAMRQALKVASKTKIDNLIMESDSRLLNNFVLGKIKVFNQISNLVNDILLLARGFRNIHFNYCNGAANIIA